MENARKAAYKYIFTTGLIFDFNYVPQEIYPHYYCYDFYLPEHNILIKIDEEAEISSQVSVNQTHLALQFGYRILRVSCSQIYELGWMLLNFLQRNHIVYFSDPNRYKTHISDLFNINHTINAIWRNKISSLVDVQ